MPNISDEGLETYNDLFKIFILLLCTYVTQILLDYNYMYVTMQS